LADLQHSKDPLLAPFVLRSLVLRNRIMSTAHAPSYVENGWPTERYRLYHEEKAKGGLALTMIGGSTNVSSDSPSAFGQLYAGNDDIIPWFEQLTAGVKSHGAAVMCQLTHMGRRTADDVGNWLPVIAPSNIRERAHRSYPKIMEASDFARVARDFAAAATRCKVGGFDGIELLSHSHLLGQFISPMTNRREDEYGGSLENRLRLAIQVLGAVREAVGSDFIVGMRITGDELKDGGLTQQDCVEVAQRFHESGMVDFLNVLAGAPYDDLGLADWVSPMGMPAARFLTVAGKIREAVPLPVFHAGGIADLATARHAIREGAVDMVGMTRAHIADPHLVNKLRRGDESRIRICVGMNFCVDRVNQGKDALCGQNAATGRERFIPHTFTADRTADTSSLRAIVVGGGPGGMESARVLAERGVQVVLFEASGTMGGQLNLAARSGSRRQMQGVIDWLASELDHLGVEVRFNSLVEASEIVAEQPNLVVMATGGLPRSLDVPGEGLASPIWTLLSEGAQPGRVLIFDDRGSHHAAVAAEAAAERGARVTVVTPDRTAFHDLGPTNYAVSMRHLYRLGVDFITDSEIAAISREGNQLSVCIRNVLSGKEKHLQYDQVFYEAGTDANDELYVQLRPYSRNDGVIDVEALARGNVVLPGNHDGLFTLVRVGDVVSSRNLHAALFDALRICARIDLSSLTRIDAP